MNLPFIALLLFLAGLYFGCGFSLLNIFGIICLAVALLLFSLFFSDI